MPAYIALPPPPPAFYAPAVTVEDSWPVRLDHNQHQTTVVPVPLDEGIGEKNHDGPGDQAFPE